MSDYQTPYFLFDLEKVRRQYERMKAAFPSATIYYAVKANNNHEVLNTLISEGSRFEVGSKREAEIALDIGARPEDLVFSSPVKLQSHIRDTFQMGVDLFVFDSEEELSKLAFLAPGSRVLVRLAVGNEGSLFPLSMKFGTPAEHAVELLEDAREMGLIPYGVAFHVGSQCARLQTWLDAMESAARVFSAVEARGIKCQALDIGGGFPVKYIEDIPSIEEIGRAVHEIFNSRFPQGTGLILEPGRYLVGESAVLVSTVIGRARRGDEEWLFLDASALHGLMEAQQVKGRFPYPVKTSKNGASLRNYVLSGPTCDPDDTILSEVLLPEVKVGDRLFIQNTGAYSFVYASNFHGFDPPEIHILGGTERFETLWGDKPAGKDFQPEYDEEKRFVFEQDGETATLYFYLKTTPERWWEPLWEMYQESLRHDESIQDQSCYDHNSFVYALNDPEYNKCIMVIGDKPVVMLLLTNNLDKAAAAYISPKFLRDEFPQAVEQGLFWYITALFTTRHLRNFGFVNLMLSTLFETVAERNWTLGGDVCDKSAFLPQFIERISEEAGFPLKTRLLGTQTYWAFIGEKALEAERVKKADSSPATISRS
jgi:ornithine decarboxylase